MADCISCPSTPPPDCACSANQQCVRISRSCAQCTQNVCQDLSNSGGGSSGAGGTAGGAVGAAAAAIVLVGVLVWLWRRRHRRGAAVSFNPRALAAVGGAADSGKAAAERHSRAVSRRFDEEKTAAGPDAPGLSLRPRSSSGNPFEDPDAIVPAETTALAQRNSDSEFSFRSSHSTQIIPIAYLPSHAAGGPVTPTATGGQIGTMEVMEAQANKAAAAALQRANSKRRSNAPTRPDRAPDLDLKLPENTRLSVSPPISAQFATWKGLGSAPPSSALVSAAGEDGHETDGRSPGSHFSMATTAAKHRSTMMPDEGSWLSANAPHLALRKSTASERSNLDYVLDAPQIVTTASAAHINFAGTASPHTVQLTRSTSVRTQHTTGSSLSPRGARAPVGSPSSAYPPTSASSPLPAVAVAEDPFEDTVDPFTDSTEIKVPSRRMTTVAQTPTFGPSPMHSASDLREPLASPVPAASESLYNAYGEGRDSQFGPASVRSSGTGSIFTSTSAMDEALRGLAASRAGSTESYASSRVNSMLDGVQFFGAAVDAMPTNTATADRPPPSPSSPLFPLPPPRSPGLQPAFAVEAASDGTRTPSPRIPDVEALGADVQGARMSTDTMRGGENDRTRSFPASVRSGYGSGAESVLDDIPFQLGFPGGIRGSGASLGGLGGIVNRDSTMSTSTAAQPSASARSTMYGVAVPPAAPPLPTLPSNATSLAALVEAEEAAAPPVAKRAPTPVTASNRVSVDSFMASAVLASEWADSDRGSIG